jgi:uncharacterized cupin superfamily protein
MPKIDVHTVPIDTSTLYPRQFRHVVNGREKKRLGIAAGLTQFGVNLTRIKPGAASALRHWHQREDEFIYMIEGELVLIENEGEILLKPGDAAGFKAGVDNGHCLVNRTTREALYLEVGSRSPSERVDYPDVDCVLERDGTTATYMRRSGERYHSS